MVYLTWLQPEPGIAVRLSAVLLSLNVSALWFYNTLKWEDHVAVPHGTPQPIKRRQLILLPEKWRWEGKSFKCCWVDILFKFQLFSIPKFFIQNSQLLPWRNLFSTFLCYSRISLGSIHLWRQGHYLTGKSEPDCSFPQFFAHPGEVNILPWTIKN